MIGDREAYARLRRLAGSADPLLRSGAAWAIGELGDPEFADALESLADDPERKVREMAARSMRKLKCAPLPDSSAGAVSQKTVPPQELAGDEHSNPADETEALTGPKTIPVRIG
jgi:HEAT repeat protein